MKRSPTDDAWRDAAIREVMRSDVVTIDAHAPVREALRLLADNGISGMPVTDGAGGVVGVISMRDVLEHLAESADEEHEGEGADYAALEEEEETEEGAESEEPEHSWHEHFPGDADAEVISVMTPELVTVPAEASVLEAARIMVQRGVHRLVVRDGRRFVGLVTATDVLARIVGR
ncbi:MAG: CBS domain-containing protein [Planctomycetota bacterium]